MIHNQQIEYVQSKTETRWVPYTDRFMFRKDKGYHWLQRLLIWGLKTLECYALFDETRTSRWVFNSSDFIDNLFSQKREVFHHYHKEGTHLLIGPSEFLELCAQTGVIPLISTQSFSVPYQWMNGLLVVPKLN